jgi:hypothetical protein
VEKFFVNIKAFRSYDQFNTTTLKNASEFFPFGWPEIFFWASKKLVTGPNGIMVAQIL